MKKSLTALAALGAFAGAASAQTSITMYGLVDAGYVYENGNPDGNTNKIQSGIQNGSRLGFKGNEDLGGGTSARFVLESGFNIDNGTLGQNGRLFGRQAWVGLGSETWGNVGLGRQYTPHYLAVAEIDPFGAGLAGNALNLIPSIIRMDNTIKYSSPAWNGFSGELAYGFGEQPGDNAAARQYGISAGYANGPLVVRAAYHRADGPIPDSTFPGGILLGDRAWEAFIGGKWDFGMAAVAAAYNKSKGGQLSDDNQEWLVGVSVPFGPATFLASYIDLNDKSPANADANQWALGLTYAVSKRTNFYTSYGQINNDEDVLYRVGNATDNRTTASGDKAFNIGVRHLF